MLDGKRDGKGMLYITDSNNNPLLYECIWEQGIPISGRFSIIFQNHLDVYTGTFDPYFYRNGHGTWTRDSQDTYTGEFKRGNRNGGGLYTFANGNTFEGTWVNHSQEGLGRFTYKATGGYEIGMYVGNVRFGIHTCYSSGGVYESSKFYHEGALFKTISLQ